MRHVIHVVFRGRVSSLQKMLTATHCNTLQHTAAHCNTLQHTATHCNTLQHTTSFCLERARERVCVIAREPVCVLLSRDRMCTCSVLQCGAVCCSVLQCGAVCCSVLQRVAVCCSIYRMCTSRYRYGVATISRLLKIIGLFCRTSSLL